MNAPEKSVQLVIGSLIALETVCEHLIARGLIEREALLGVLAAKLAMRRSKSLDLAAWPLEFLRASIAGEELPPME